MFSLLLKNVFLCITNCTAQSAVSYTHLDVYKRQGQVRVVKSRVSSTGAGEAESSTVTRAPAMPARRRREWEMSYSLRSLNSWVLPSFQFCTGR